MITMLGNVSNHWKSVVTISQVKATWLCAHIQMTWECSDNWNPVTETQRSFVFPFPPLGHQGKIRQDGRLSSDTSNGNSLIPHSTSRLLVSMRERWTYLSFYLSVCCFVHRLLSLGYPTGWCATLPHLEDRQTQSYSTNLWSYWDMTYLSLYLSVIWSVLVTPQAVELQLFTGLEDHQR